MLKLIQDNPIGFYVGVTFVVLLALLVAIYLFVEVEEPDGECWARPSEAVEIPTVDEGEDPNHTPAFRNRKHPEVFVL